MDFNITPWKLTTLFIVIITLDTASSSKIVSLMTEDSSGAPLAQGSDVKMVCTASGFSGSIGQHIQVIKTIVPSDGSGPIRVAMATNMQINREYASLTDSQGNKRYSSELEVINIDTDTVAILTFKINGITGADFGSYNCSVSYGIDEVVTADASVDLKIQGRLDAIHWLKRLPDGSTDNIDGEIITLAPSSNFSISCGTAAIGTLVQPDFVVYFTENKQRVNITSWFTPDLPHDEVIRIPGKAYTFNYTSKRSVSYSPENPDKRLNDKLLVCEATSPGLFETLRALITLRVEYLPTMTCIRSNDPLTIKCSGEGNPLPQIQVATDSNLTVSSADLQGKSTMKWQQFTLQRNITGNKIDFLMRTDKSQFNFSSLVLKATNIHGSSNAVKMGFENDNQPSSSWCPFYTATTILISFMVFVELVLLDETLLLYTPVV